MATKTTKKSVAKKATAKKPAVKKATVKPAPVMEHKCNCEAGCPCGCHKHGAAHIIKHIIVWAIIFALGMACGKMMCCKKMHKPMQAKHVVFTNGCLDMASISCPKMAEEIMTADVNADECVSIEEYKAWKKEHKSQNKGFRGPRKQK